MPTHRNPRPKVPKQPPADNSDPGKTPPRRRYATREDQVRELLEHIRRRDRRVAKALVDVLTGASPRVLTAFGTLMDFVANETRAK